MRIALPIASGINRPQTGVDLHPPSLSRSARNDENQVGKASLGEAAAGFEAIFIRQMLAAARASRDSDSLFGSEAETTFRQMLDDRFADVAAQQGAFGIGEMLESQLSQKGR